MSASKKLQKLIIEKDSRVCVGLDPIDIPGVEAGEFNATKTLAFLKKMVLAIKPYAVAVKPNIAFYEAYGIPGLIMFYKISEFAASEGLFLIGDVKRGDIGKTADMYAKAYLYKNSPFDMITVNPLFGSDGILPFTEMCAKNDKGIYILTKTSNKSSGELQDLIEKDNDLSISEIISNLVAKWGSNLISDGNSSIGSVVGGTYPEYAELLRELHPNIPFLIPGYGAQGGTAKDIAGLLKTPGNIDIVNSSSGIMYAYKKMGITDLEQIAFEQGEAAKAMMFDLNNAMS